MIGLKNQSEMFKFYEIIGKLSLEKDFEFFEEKSGEPQKDWTEKMNKRKKEILRGWNELESRVKEYIKENITKDIESLPYISEREEEQPTPFCPCGH